MLSVSFCLLRHLGCWWVFFLRVLSDPRSWGRLWRSDGLVQHILSIGPGEGWWWPHWTWLPWWGLLPEVEPSRLCLVFISLRTVLRMLWDGVLRGLAFIIQFCLIDLKPKVQELVLLGSWLGMRSVCLLVRWFCCWSRSVLWLEGVMRQACIGSFYSWILASFSHGIRVISFWLCSMSPWTFFSLHISICHRGMSMLWEVLHFFFFCSWFLILLLTSGSYWSFLLVFFSVLVRCLRWQG